MDPTHIRRPAKTNDTVAAVIVPSLKVGAACGGVGFLFGGTSGVIKGTAPFLFAAASGIQTFALGTTFWAFRSSGIQAWKPDAQTSGDLTKVSTVAGGLSGGVVALVTRGRSNVIPAILMWSLFGCVGQSAANSFYATPSAAPKESFWRRMADKSWSPVKVLNDEEYVDMLRKKMLRIDVEIAVLDDKIAAIRKEDLEGSEDATTSKTTVAEDSRP